MVTTLNLLLNAGNTLCITQMLNRTPNMLRFNYNCFEGVSCVTD